MVRGVFINRADSHSMTLAAALDRYLSDITPKKKPSTQIREKGRIKTLRSKLKKYSLAALTPKIVGQYRDERLREGKSHSTVGSNSRFSPICTPSQSRNGDSGS
jgi:hypothetical protein